MTCWGLQVSSQHEGRFRGPPTLPLPPAHFLAPLLLTFTAFFLLLAQEEPLIYRTEWEMEPGVGAWGRWAYGISWRQRGRPLPAL